MMKRLRRAMATRSASNSASASGLSTCLVRDTFCCWSSPKPLPAPLPSLSALAQYLADCLREIESALRSDEWLLSPRSQTFLGACRQDADASKAAIRVAVGEPDFVRWATRFRVAPLRLTNP